MQQVSLYLHLHDININSSYIKILLEMIRFYKVEGFIAFFNIIKIH